MFPSRPNPFQTLFDIKKLIFGLKILDFKQLEERERS